MAYHNVCYHLNFCLGELLNDYYAEVDSMASVFDKIRLEGHFHSLCNGGAITYIEFTSAILENAEYFTDGKKAEVRRRKSNF